MNTMLCFLLSFLLSLTLCLSLQVHLTVAQPIPSPTGDNLIDKACQSAPDKSFCINLLKSDHTSPKADMKGLAFIALKNAEKNATATSLFIKIVLDKPETDLQPGVEEALSDCNEHYLTAIDLIEDSIDALVSDVPDDVYKFMKAAVADIDECDASVKGQEGAASEVASKNLGLHKLIDNALSVAQIAQLAH